MIEDYIKYILSQQCSSGGFGYINNKCAMIEPTCYSLLALYKHDTKSDNFIRASDWLLSLQEMDGGWKLFDIDDISSPYGTSIAIITLNQMDKNRYIKETQAGIRYLETQSEYFKNNELCYNAWGWNKGTFIGIEPTAYAVLSLKLLNSTKEERIKEGEKFFLSSVCLNNGWTFGYPIDRNNPASTSVVYAPVEAQLNITALVLLALQGTKTNLSDHINLLLKDYKNSYCPMSLSLSVLALDAYREKTSNIVKHLNNIMKTDKYVKDKVIYNALSALANQVKLGYNPLCMNR